MGRLRSTTWRHGDRTKIAESAGISRGYLSHILQGEKVPKPRTALSIVAKANLLGYKMVLNDLLFPELTDNPLLKKK